MTQASTHVSTDISVEELLRDYDFVKQKVDELTRLKKEMKAQLLDRFGWPTSLDAGSYRLTISRSLRVVDIEAANIPSVFHKTIPDTTKIKRYYVETGSVPPGCQLEESGQVRVSPLRQP